MEKHPLITTQEEFNREKYYYKIYWKRLIINIKIILIYLYCRNVYQICLGVGWVGLDERDMINIITKYIGKD